MSIREAAALLGRASHPVAFTGAGISTESGLPDFRSPGGMWAAIDPTKVASRSALQRDPRAFYEFYRQRLERLGRASPNAAHLALAALERAGRLGAVITQNVDGLHQVAGSQRVIEIHGNLREAACTGCGRIGPIAILAEAIGAGDLPRCPDCAHLLKPNVVLFDDLLPEAAWRAATEAACASDLMLIVGSSLQVTPAAFLPQETLDALGGLIIVNREETPYDRQAALVIHDEAGRVLPAIVAAVDASGGAAQREEASARAPK